MPHLPGPIALVHEWFTPRSVGGSELVVRELERREHATKPPTPQQELLLAMPENETASALRRMLEGVDPESLSPRQALDVLYRLKELLQTES